MQQNIEDIYPLSPLQQGLLFHSLEGEEGGLYVQELGLRLRGDLDARTFEEAWQRVVDRHPILRTAFVWEGVPEPVQVVFRKIALPFEHQDWRGLGAEEQERRGAAWLRANREKGFDFTKAPLMRVALVRLEDDLHRMIWSHHHILLDGWSLPAVLREVLATYEAARRGAEASLPRRRPYRDFIAWLRQQRTDRAEPFWREALRGFRAPLALALDRPPAGAGPARGERLVRLPRAETELLQAAARQHQLTLNSVVQGAWAVLLGRYTGQDDVVFGAISSGRPAGLAGSDAMIGLFINTLPVRARIDSAARVTDWLRRLQAQGAEIRQVEHTPLQQIHAWSEVPRGLRLFETLLDFASFPLDRPAGGGEGGASALRLEGAGYTERTNYPLAVIAAPSQELPLRALYDARRFEAATIERMLGHLRTLLEGWRQAPETRLGDWSLLTPAERFQLLAEWNDTAGETPERTIHALVEEQVRRTPGALAVVDGARRWTYREVDEQANRLARLLDSLDAGPGTLVGISLERGGHMIPALLGILKAGACYVPLDPAYPPARLRWILSSLRIRHLVTDVSRLASLGAMERPDDLAHVIALDAPAGTDAPWSETQLWTAPCLEEMDGGALPPRGTPGDLAYIIFTSGSTGTPKGVMERHRPVTGLIDWVNRTFGVGPGDQVLFVTSLSFDLSVYDVFGLLAAGGSIRVASGDEVREPSQLARILATEPVTFWDSAPAALQQLVPFLPALPAEEGAGAPLRLVFLSGDWVPVALPGQLRAAFPEARVVALGGATEATVWSNFFRVGEVPPSWPSIPYGRPIRNARYHVLAGDLEPCPIGVAGDLYIGGDCLAFGYAGEAVLTATKFIPDPFAAAPGEVLYRTGDRARYLPDGNQEFLGRLDNQVKIRGFRIELGEVETVLREHPGVRDAVALAREDEPGRKRLVAYVVPAAPAGAEAQELRSFLTDRLPGYMVPAAFVPLAALPLTANGKVDRRALPSPEDVAAPEPEGFEAPRTEAEEILARAWAKVLRRDRVGAHDNFFELGGDSILSLQVVAEAARQGLRITSRQLFETQTVAELAALAVRDAGPEAEQSPRSGRVPFTPIQSWFFEREPADPHYFNQAVLLEVRRPLDPERLARALAALAAHHDALRLRFHRDGGSWVQVLAADPTPPPVSRFDLSGLPAADRAAALRGAASALQAALDLAAGPLAQAAVFHLGAGEPARLLLAVHHLVVDGVSWRVLLEDLQTAEEQLARGAAVSLPRRTASFRQWAEHIAAHARSGALDSEKGFWLAEGRRRAAPLPVDHLGGGNTAGSAATLTVELDEGETRDLLQVLPEVHGTRINDVLLTALAWTLARGAGRETLLVDLEGHGREEIGAALDLSRSVGWFTSLFPVLLDLAGAASPLAALRSVQQQLRAIPGHGVGYGLLRYLGPDTALAAELRAMPQAEVSFNYFGQLDQALPASSPFAPAAESAGPAQSPRQPRRHLLEINGGVTGGRLRLSWRFSRELHRQETVAGWAAAYLETLREILRRSRGLEAGEPYPLSPLQQGLLFHALFEPGSASFVAQLSYRVTGDLDLDALEAAWQRVVARHDVLRTAFLWQDLDEPLQAVCRNVPFAISRHDLLSLPAEEREGRVADLLQTDRRQAFDLSRPPLFRISALRLEGSVYELAWTFHHLLLDGWSLPLLLAELSAFYAAERRGESLALEPPVPFRRAIEWLRARSPEAAETFWHESLRGFQEPALLPGGREPKVSRRGEILRSLSKEETAALSAFARRHRLTLATVAQGAMALLLGRLSGKRDVAFGAIVSGRPADLPGHESMVGMFINNLPVRVQLTPGTPVAGWLGDLQLHQAALSGFDHVSLAQIRKWSEVPRHLPLFECTLAFNNYPVETALSTAAGGGLEVSRVRVSESTSFPLDITITPGRRLAMRFMYEASRFSEAAMARIVRLFENALRRLADGVDATVGDLQAALAAAEERDQAVERERQRRTSFAKLKNMKPETVGLVAMPGSELED